MTMETAPSADTKQELMRGRGMVAGTIVVGHAIKHLYNSGQSSLIMPEISRDLNLTRAQFGSLASVSQVAWWSATMAAATLETASATAPAS